jgi:hypothetical protein
VTTKGSEEDVRPTRKEAKMVNRRNARSAAPALRTGRRLVLLGVLASLWALGPTAVAAADSPVREGVTIELSGPHFLSGFCGFTISQEGTAHVARTTFDDARVMEQIDLDLELAANGMVAFEHPRFTVMVDPAAGTVTLTGTLVNIEAPGAGLLLQEVGRVVQELATGDPLFSAGRFMIMEGKLGTVCAFFAAAP